MTNINSSAFSIFVCFFNFLELMQKGLSLRMFFTFAPSSTICANNYLSWTFKFTSRRYLVKSKPISSLYVNPERKSTLMKVKQWIYKDSVNSGANFGPQSKNFKFRIVIWYIFGGWKHFLRLSSPRLNQKLFHKAPAVSL